MAGAQRTEQQTTKNNERKKVIKMVDARFVPM
jgi:hypothetical protein